MTTVLQKPAELLTGMHVNSSNYSIGVLYGVIYRLNSFQCHLHSGKTFNLSEDRSSWEPESPQTAEGALTVPCPPAQACCPSSTTKNKSKNDPQWSSGRREVRLYTAALAVQMLLNYYTKLDAQIWGLRKARFWRLFPLILVCI